MEQNKKVTFISQNPLCGIKIDSPKPASKHLPTWYKDAHKYLSTDGSPGSLDDVKSSKAFPTYKNCVPFFDGMTTGYIYETICDLIVSEKDGVPIIETEPGFEEFVGFRGRDAQFINGEGFYPEHFHWVPPWAIKTPDGYSAFYINPVNRIDLPFYTFSGIIDNDKVQMTGQYPFILKKGFTGLIPKGTPMVQIIPIKRESWESDVDILSEIDLILDRQKKPFKYRKKKVNYYRNFDWTRKHYG